MASGCSQRPWLHIHVSISVNKPINLPFKFLILDIDECGSQLCNSTGTHLCVDMQNAFMCECKSGYTGMLCDTGDLKQNLVHIFKLNSIFWNKEVGDAITREAKVGGVFGMPNVGTPAHSVLPVEIIGRCCHRETVQKAVPMISTDLIGGGSVRIREKKCTCCPQ